MKLLQIMRKCGAISGKSKIRSDPESGAWSGRGILCGQVQLPGPVRGEDYAIAEFATWRNAAEATIEGGIRRRVRLNRGSDSYSDFKCNGHNICLQILHEPVGRLFWYITKRPNGSASGSSKLPGNILIKSHGMTQRLAIYIRVHMISG